MYCVSFSADARRVVSGSADRTIRIWNADAHELIGEALLGYSNLVFCVSESADGCHILSRDSDGITIIRKCENRSIVWKSKNNEQDFQNDVTDVDKRSETNTTDGEDAFENEITNDEAEMIIRSCGQQTPHLWPDSFLAYSAELYCDNDDESAYSNFNGENTLIAASVGFHWTYHIERKVLAVGQRSGAVAICKFINK